MNEPTLNERRDASVLNRLSATTRRTLSALLKSGVAERVIAEAEAETIQERKALIAQLASAEKQAKQSAPRLEAVAIKAFRTLEEAELALARAREEYRIAAAMVSAPEYTLQGERKRITEELHASADPRLAEFRLQLADFLSNHLVIALQSWPNPAKRTSPFMPATASNIEDVTTARAVIRDALVSVDAARLQPLTSLEVSEFLNSMCMLVAPALARVELNPPSLSAEDLEPGVPLRWGGQSAWISGAVQVMDKEERARQRDHRQSRIAADEKVN